MPGQPKRTEHPKYAYLIGSFFAIITLAVIVAIIYNITFSKHGPAVLRPLKAKIEEGKKSGILEEVRRQEEYEKHRHFHIVVDFPEMPENVRPVCDICHSGYPHSKNKKVRALLNMHTQFFVCEACHLEEKKEAGAKLLFKWYNPLDEDPKGPFFGTSYDPETGNLAKVKDQFSRIAPFFVKGAKLESAIQIQDAPLAQNYMKVRDRLTPEQKDNVKQKFHINIKSKGPHDCESCHSEKGMLDLRKLGFSENRVVDIEHLNIKGMITKYEKFYLPNLFNE